jgi:hypothetical protein
MLLDWLSAPEFASLQERQLSFNNWPHAFPPETALAAAGFYFLGYKDKVTCFCCGVNIEDWRQAHDPLERHLASSSYCPFLQQIIVRDKNTPRAYLMTPALQLEDRGLIDNDLFSPYKCTTCLVVPVQILLLPCLHSCVCEHCAPLSPRCPVCQVQITGLVTL